MRRRLAIGALGLMVLLGTAIVGWSQEGAPAAPAPAQGQRPMGGGQGRWGEGARRFGGYGRGEFGREGRMRGPGMRRMGGQRGGRGGFGGAGLARLAENPRVRQYLGLTDEQVGRLHKISVDAEKASVETRANLQLRHIELRELLRADNPDHDAIMRKMDEVNSLQGRMEKERVETMLAARSVLTPEQLKKVKEFMQNREAGGPRGPMQRRGGPGGAAGRPSARPAAPGAAAPRSQEPPVQ